MGVDRGDRSGGSEDRGPAESDAGLTSRHVPGQGGPPGAESAESAEPGEGAGTAAAPGVPAQRKRRGAGKRAAKRSGKDAGQASSAAGSSAAGASADEDGQHSDAWLISRMREGDAGAYDELYRRHADAVRRYARTCCRDSHTADDLTNEVFARTLQAVRGGKGPETSVRAYLLTSVRHVAAAWSKTRKREHLVDDFAVFVQSADRPVSTAADADTLDLGADVRAMHEAEQTLVVQAFKSLSEDDQMLLWHTAVEGTKPQDVAPLLGKTSGATATAAHRAREHLKQAYLQAHVSQALTAGGDCARFADRLGAYARGGLRMRAERGLQRHLEQCTACNQAAVEVKDLNEHIRLLVPVALIGWFATAGGAKAFGALMAGTGAAAAAGGAGAAAGSSAGGVGGAASEGLGTPAKVGVGVGVAAVAAAALAYALTGAKPDADRKDHHKPPPPAAAPEAPPKKPKPKPKPPPPKPAPPAAKPEPKPKPEVEPAKQEKPKPKPPAPEPKPKPKPPEKPQPKPPPKPAPEPPEKPSPEPPEKPSPKPPPPPPPPPADHKLSELKWDLLDPGAERKGPTIRSTASSWVWQRQGLKIHDQRFGHGVTVHAPSSVTIDLNRACTSYDAVAGMDDMSFGHRAVRFSVFGDGARLWRSGFVGRGQPPAPVHVPLSGVKSIRLVVEPRTLVDRTAALADWADSSISCR